MAGGVWEMPPTQLALCHHLGGEAPFDPSPYMQPTQDAVLKLELLTRPADLGPESGTKTMSFRTQTW